MPKILMSSMRAGGTPKSVAFDHSCKPFPFAKARDIYDISGLKEAYVYFLAYLIPPEVLYTKFFESVESSCPRFLEMPGEGFAHPLAVLREEAELKGVVAVVLFYFLLNH